ncbi:MAG TPA: phosphoribosylformylglycinamidine synthase subunit PurS [Candidatus Limnocylindrales bacterium]|nr:phosphoribosylformylglycinamidine synthase subunit PurS [Candidatus Limnocylindrales bacterium]
MSAWRFAVSVMPRPGILDPQGRAVESALPQLDAASVHGVRVGRRIELTVEAGSEGEARAVVERLATDLLANPLVEDWQVALL